MLFLKKKIPILGWITDYSIKLLKKDAVAGLTVGVMLIPQGMAYALIAGLPPVYGLYASVFPQIIYAIFGTSRKISVAPVAMDSLLVATGLALLAKQSTSEYIQLAILLSLLVGFFQFALGIFRMGFIANLLSKPVIKGFTSAAAIIIAINQLKHILGITSSKSNHVFHLIPSLIKNISQLNSYTLFLALFVVLLLKTIPKISKAIPSALVAVLCTIAIVFCFNLNELDVKIIGEIPKGLPSFQLLDLTNSNIKQLVPLAFTLAIISFMEAFSVAKALESKAKDDNVKPNQELIALGLSNMVGSLFQSYPVTGSFSRSAINEQAGAKTQITALFCALLIACTLLFLTPIFYFLPYATLGTIILLAVLRLIDFNYAKNLYKTDKQEFLILLITFMITISLNMVVGILTGIACAILLFIYKSAYPHIALLGRLKNYPEYRNLNRFDNLSQWDNIIIVRHDAPLTFINVQNFKTYLENQINKKGTSISYIILDCAAISFLDPTAASTIKEMIESLKEGNITLLLSDVIGPVRDVLQKTKLTEILTQKAVFIDIEEAVRFATTNNKGRFKEYALQTNNESLNN